MAERPLCLFISFSFWSHERLHPSQQAHAPILFVITMFPVSTALVVLSFCSLPFTFTWPQNLSDLAQLGRELHGYSLSGAGALAHVIAIVSAATIWMHAWSIPGSVLWVSRIVSFPLPTFSDLWTVLDYRMFLPGLYFLLFWQLLYSPCLQLSDLSSQLFSQHRFPPFSPAISHGHWPWHGALSMLTQEQVLVPKPHHPSGSG